MSAISQMTNSNGTTGRPSRMISSHSLRAILLTELLQGMALTLRYFFKPKVTLNYPYEKAP